MGERQREATIGGAGIGRNHFLYCFLPPLTATEK